MKRARRCRQSRCGWRAPEGVFKECDRPGKEHHRPNGPERDDLCGLKLEVQVPGERHEDVRNDEEPDRQKAFAEHSGNTVAE